MNEKDFAIRLARLREKKGVSARDMSLSIGQNPGYINNIETGKSKPSARGTKAHLPSGVFFAITTASACIPATATTRAEIRNRSRSTRNMAACYHRLGPRGKHQNCHVMPLMMILRSRAFHQPLHDACRTGRFR